MTVKELCKTLARCQDAASVSIQVGNDEVADIVFVQCDFGSAESDVDEMVIIHGTA